jgi:hypothetical protein
MKRSYPQSGRETLSARRKPFGATSKTAEHVFSQGSLGTLSSPKVAAGRNAAWFFCLSFCSWRERRLRHIACSNGVIYPTLVSMLIFQVTDLRPKLCQRLIRASLPSSAQFAKFDNWALCCHSLRSPRRSAKGRSCWSGRDRLAGSLRRG